MLDRQRETSEQIAEGPKRPSTDGAQQPSKASYREALASNRNPVGGKRLAYVEGYKDGIIRFTKQYVQENSAKWKLCLLGLVIGIKIPFNVMSGFVAAKWNQVEAPKIILNDNGVFVFIFTMEEDLLWVLQQGTWLIGGNKPLVLKRWSEGAKLDPSSFETTQVWASLPNLDVRFWDDNFFEKIGSAIGRSIIVDKVTANQERLSFARLLVEVTDKEKLLKDITFIGEDDELIKQPIVYDWMLDICEKCKVFGHVEGQCNSNKSWVRRNYRPKPTPLKRWMPRSAVIKGPLSNTFDTYVPPAAGG